MQHLEVNLEVVTQETRLIEKIKLIESVWKRILEQREEEWRQQMRPKVKYFKENREDVLSDLEFEHRTEKGAFEMFTTCPECYQCTLIAEGDYRGICSNTNCEEWFPLTACSVCGGLAIGFRWEGVVCESCEDRFNELVNQPD